MTEPTICAHIFTNFDAFASRRGFDFDALLEKNGVARSQLADGDTQLPLNAVASIFNDASVACDDPCLGLHWAEAVEPGSGGVLGYLLINSKSVRVAMQTIARYVTLHVTSVDVTFEESDGVGRLSWRFPPSFNAPRAQYASYAMALIVIRLRRAAGATWMPMGVDLEHRDLGCREDVLRILGPNVRYDCGINTLHVRESVLNRTSDDADIRLFELIRKLGDRMLEERKANSDIVSKTRRAVVTLLDDGVIGLEEVAQNLGMSGRTLQYRLASSETSFETVLQETRRDLSDIYLRDTDLMLTDIAFMLGFSELSAYTRAAGKWFGMSPRERRLELRKG